MMRGCRPVAALAPHAPPEFRDEPKSGHRLALACYQHLKRTPRVPWPTSPTGPRIERRFSPTSPMDSEIRHNPPMSVRDRSGHSSTSCPRVGTGGRRLPRCSLKEGGPLGLTIVSSPDSARRLTARLILAQCCRDEPQEKAIGAVAAGARSRHGGRSAQPVKSRCNRRSVLQVSTDPRGAGQLSHAPHYAAPPPPVKSLVTEH